jgi:hypothetical protein
MPFLLTYQAQILTLPACGDGAVNSPRATALYQQQ